MDFQNWCERLFDVIACIVILKCLWWVCWRSSWELSSTHQLLFKEVNDHSQLITPIHTIDLILWCLVQLSFFGALPVGHTWQLSRQRLNLWIVCCWRISPVSGMKCTQMMVLAPRLKKMTTVLQNTIESETMASYRYNSCMKPIVCRSNIYDMCTFT